MSERRLREVKSMSEKGKQALDRPSLLLKEIFQQVNYNTSF